MLFVLAVIVVAMATSTGDVAKADRPYADWDWGTTDDGDVVLTHKGGEAIPRDTVEILGDALNGTISDLGDSGDERIVKPFDDSVVSKGDTLVISSEALNEGTVVLYWKKPSSDQSATLAHLEYPIGFNRPPYTLNEAK